MKKLLATTSFVAVLALSGCMSTGGAANLADMNYQDMSCDEINAVFADVDGTNGTMSALGNIAGAFGVNTGGLTTAQAQGTQLLMQAKNTARPIALAKGCQPTF